MLIKNLDFQIDTIYKFEGFEKQLEKTKAVGLEIILSIQNFTTDPSRTNVLSIKNKVADYSILYKQISRNAKDSELTDLIILNESFENTMKVLNLKETFHNIQNKYKKEIHSRYEERLDVFFHESLR